MFRRCWSMLIVIVILMSMVGCMGISPVVTPNPTYNTDRKVHVKIKTGVYMWFDSVSLSVNNGRERVLTVSKVENYPGSSTTHYECDFDVPVGMPVRIMVVLNCNFGIVEGIVEGANKINFTSPESGNLNIYIYKPNDNIYDRTYLIKYSGNCAKYVTKRQTGKF